MFSPTGRFGKPKSFSPAEDRKLEAAVKTARATAQAAGADASWSDIRTIFSKPNTTNKRTANELRDRYNRSTAINGTLQDTRQCAYGLSTASRCTNKQGMGMHGQSIPNNSTVLSHAGIRNSDWAPNLWICSDHGQDQKKRSVLSPQNLASRTSQQHVDRVKRLRSPSTPQTPPITSRARRKAARVHPSPPPAPFLPEIAGVERVSPDARKRTREARDQVHRDRVNDRAKALARENMRKELLALGDDPLEELLVRFQQLELKYQADTQKSKNEIDHYKKWVTEFRPTDWDHVDEQWVKVWTPFTCKASAVAFYEEFIPRVPMF